ncbi:hypothetical protein M569_05933 [Genlisea aurea]|uniref:Uncharacterized protein n=1 Tax=Genlisea aurea TaxID=192259 RepID=S8CQ67_9LAMI|nr:hypothetical protein M569_05933 [Genlisea aurea]
MKAIIIPLIFLVVLLPVFTHGQRQFKYCPAPPLARRGSCSSNVDLTCFDIVLANYPASLMPTRIRCVDVGPNKSQCTSQIICN